MNKTKTIKKAAGTLIAASMACSSLTGVYAEPTATAPTAAPTTVAAADAVTVYLNGTPLSFPDAQPQISSSRTYVPIRQTAEYLGLSIDWNSKTETLTFTRDGITIAHTMRSSIVYVNGAANTYDSPSINKNNRTLMPIRMLADAIGASVEWDNATRSVKITTNTAAGATITSCNASETVVQGGKEIVLTAVASKNATKVKFENGVTGDTLTESTEYTDNGDQRLFTAIYKTENTGSDSVVLQIKAVPGTDSAYATASDATKTVAIVVSPGKASSSDDDNKKNNKSEYLISCELEDSKIEKGDYAYVTVVTTDDVEKVRISSSVGDETANSTKYTENDDGEREFEVKYKMTNKGSVDLYVYLYVDDAYEDKYETLTCKVVDGDDSNGDELEIYDAECIQEKVYRGENAHICVTTSYDITKIVIEDEDGDKVAKESYYSYKDTDEEQLVWDLEFEMESSSREKYTIIASDDNGDTVEETIRIQGKTYSKSDVCVLSVTQKSNSVKEGDDCKIIIKATSAVDKVTIYDEDGEEIETLDSGSVSGGTRTFTYTLEVKDISEIYEVTGFGNDGDQDTINFKLIGEGVEEVKINDVSVEESTVSLDDEIEITVTTSTAVTKLWVEDSDGERVSKKMTKPTDTSSNEYEWELSFDPEEKGRATYTVIASDDDDNTDEEDFRVTVTK